MAYLNGGRSPKYTPDLSCAYELIIAIANEGGTDAVMNAARAAGARGGTVLHGKGTGAKGAPKFYNISIAAEKEVILIVSAAGQKAEIMRSILRKAGPDSDAGAIVFSLPASAVAGFGLLEENLTATRIGPGRKRPGLNCQKTAKPKVSEGRKV